MSSIKLIQDSSVTDRIVEKPNYSDIQFTNVNFTKKLRRKHGEVLFNPAVVHWKDDLYLCTYRVFIRYAGLDTRKFADNPFFNPNHPWLGGKPSLTFWSAPLEFKGYDVTRIALIRITGSKVKTLKKYGDYPGVDTRLFKISENKFVLTGNSNYWVYDQNLDIAKGNCKELNGCMLMYASILTINEDLKLDIGKPVVMCPQFSNRMEKNWSLWLSPRGELLVSTWISPRHEIFHLRIDGDRLSCPTVRHITSKNNILGSLKSYYNKIVHISLSTPALRMSSGRYVAFGHIKYTYKDVGELSSNSPLRRFTDLLIEKKKKLHPTYVYLMFLYEFSPEFPYNITRISDMFIPESAFSLVFPNNLTYSPEEDKYIMSYGDHDNQCWLLYMSPYQIEEALKVMKNPREVKFLLL
jgi:hypothetical protein